MSSLVLGKFPIPKNSPSFPLDRAIPRQPKKGAAASPLNCQVKILANQPNREKNCLIAF